MNLDPEYNRIFEPEVCDYDDVFFLFNKEIYVYTRIGIR